MEFEIMNLYGEDVKEIEDMINVLHIALNHEKIESAIFNVILVNNDKIWELNREYRHVDRPTDVITFALEDVKDVDLPIRMLGDIYISVDKAKSQALEYGHSLKRELCFLTVHGFLHLLCYDHMTKDDEEVMFALQEVILNEYGI